jgi:hypothetical protein
MHFLRLLVCMFFGVTVFNTGAQIVNIENQRLDAKKEGWKTDIDFNFTIIKNTRVILQFGNRNRIAFNKEEHHVMLLTDFGLIKADGSDFVNSGFTHLRYGYNLRKFHRVSWESFSQAQYNKVQMIDLRILLGTGTRVEVIKKDSIALNLGTFIMAEYEEQSDNIVNQTARYSLFVSFDWQFSKTAGINTITYLQPTFFDPSDYRVSSETSLRFSITKKLSFKVVYNLFYDTNPPDGIPTTSYYLNNAISVRF